MCNLYSMTTTHQAMRQLFRVQSGRRGIRGTQKNPVDGEHMLYGFLTTAPNDEVKPVHAKAMPAILTTPEECDTWLTGPPSEALELQRPLPGGQLTVVARGEREDPPPGAVPSPAEPTLL